MLWLTHDEAIRRFRMDEPQELQHISFAADIASLRQEIPLPPHYVPTSEGPPSSVDQWFCQLGNHNLIVECPAEKDEWQTNVAAIILPFRSRCAVSSDWSILPELHELPASISIMHPLHITVRTSTIPRFAVYRPDSRGWNTPFYWTETRADAEGLLAYLGQEPRNDGCFVGKPERPGEWEIVIDDAGGERVVGVYPDKVSSLQVACDSSYAGLPRSSLIVRDTSGAHPDEVYGIRERKAVLLTDLGRDGL